MQDFRRPTPDELYQVGFAAVCAMAAAAGAGLVNLLFAAAQKKLETKPEPPKEQK